MGILLEVQLIDSGVKGIVQDSNKACFQRRIYCAADGIINPVPFEKNGLFFGLYLLP